MLFAQNGNDGLHYSETPSEVDGLNDMSISFSKEEDPSSDDTHFALISARLGISTFLPNFSVLYPIIF